MQNTLHLFDELLEHDPGSKIFFPLARLYKRHGYIKRAIEIVQKGIGHHPDYLEAQFFLIELFYDTGDVSAAEAQAHALFQKLLIYDKFWFALRTYYAKNNQEDMQLASYIMERKAHDSQVDLLKLLTCGIAHYSDQSTDQENLQEPEHDLDAEEVTQFFINSGIKTKTMAKLLAAQGEHSQAIAICDELLAQANQAEDIKDLQILREQSLHIVQAQEVSQTEKTTKLYHVLNDLATRLENRSKEQPVSTSSHTN
ncbi:MAG: hypothetical protein RBR42_09255 [Desulfomicrobium sp.]|nr:hypothetical protein [Desulfomicrobium sp.]NLV97734.1 hypothetical protein [Desulfovibrionales bacterium]